MAKSVSDRITDSFEGDGSTDQAKECSQTVYAAWKDISASLSRSALLIFVLMAVFELLVYQRTSTVISVGTFTLVNAPIVQIALPAIIAFVIYDGIRLSVRWFRLQRAYVALTKIYAPEQRNNNLDLLIAPNLPSLWDLGPSGRITQSTADKYMGVTNSYVSYTMMFAVPVAFEFQAYYRLLEKFGIHNAFLWISLAITVIFGVCTAVYVALVRYAN